MDIDTEYTPVETPIGEPQAYQAEPFEETLAAWRERIILRGGTVEEHYALRKIDDLQLARDVMQSERDDAIRKASEQSEYIQREGLTKFEFERLKAERDGLRQAKQDSEAQGARNYAELMEVRAEVERLWNLLGTARASAVEHRARYDSNGGVDYWRGRRHS